MNSVVAGKIIEALKELILVDPEILAEVAASELAISRTTLNKILKKEYSVSFKGFKTLLHLNKLK